MKKLTAAFLGAASIALSAVYIVPRYWEGIPESVRSQTVVTINYSAKDTHWVYGIPVELGGQSFTVDMEYLCVPVVKADCPPQRELEAATSIISWRLASQTGELIAPITVDVRVIDNGNNWLVCAMVAGTDGKAYLVNSCRINGASGVQPGDVCVQGSGICRYNRRGRKVCDNPSYIMVRVFQVCR